MNVVQHKWWFGFGSLRKPARDEMSQTPSFYFFLLSCICMCAHVSFYVSILDWPWFSWISASGHEWLSWRYLSEAISRESDQHGTRRFSWSILEDPFIDSRYQATRWRFSRLPGNMATLIWCSRWDAMCCVQRCSNIMSKQRQLGELQSMLDLTSFLVTSGRHVNHVRSNHGIHGNLGRFGCAVLGQDVRLRCTFAGTDSGGISSFGDPNRVARTAAWQNVMWNLVL